MRRSNTIARGANISPLVDVPHKDRGRGDRLLTSPADRLLSAAQHSLPAAALLALTYNPRSGHVKRSGAVVGRIERGPGCWGYHCFCLRYVVTEASTVEALMPKVRRHYEELSDGR